jgi:hypothetical protein
VNFSPAASVASASIARSVTCTGPATDVPASGSGFASSRRWRSSRPTTSRSRWTRPPGQPVHDAHAHPFGRAHVPHQRVAR